MLCCAAMSAQDCAVLTFTGLSAKQIHGESGVKICVKKEGVT